jgi:3-hydroxyacyl-CoA dehydrogenase/enoyl-CoA hydratase/3-hydroxybutyryl-CoA epimerase
VTGTAVDSAIKYSRDADGIVTLVMDDPETAVNTMNDHFVVSLRLTLDRLESERDQIVGVLLTSAKASFFAGGDLERLRSHDPANDAAELRDLDLMKNDFRRLETLGRPVVALINGTALGGGLEVALAAHHRIAADVAGSRIGLPEVGLGLFPGAGGVSRVTRMLGLAAALSTVILPATRFRPAEALEVGLVDEVVSDVAELDARGRAWIAANPSASQPWDQPETLTPARLETSAYTAILAAADGAGTDIDTALAIESRHLVHLLGQQVTKNIISLLFFDAVAAGSDLPDLSGLAGSQPPREGELVALARAVIAAHEPGTSADAAALNLASVRDLGFPVRTGGAVRYLEQIGDRRA